MKYYQFSILLLSFCLLGCGQKEGEIPREQTENIVDITTIDTNQWWNDTVFYEIFVRSFYDSDGNGIGDIRGIIEKLDYLNDGNPNTNTDLGVTGIWLMPIFPSPSYHGYDVTDFRAINPDYGTMDDFKALINAAHARGIKVIIDFVGNHTSDQHPWFTNSADNGDKRNWYRWTNNAPDYRGPWGQTVWHERNSNYYYGVFWGGMPDLNYTNQEVTNEIKNTVRYWYEDVGVDGFRIDAVKHWIENGSQQENTAETLRWWREFYAFQKGINPSLMTVGEAWTSTQNIAPYSEYRLDYCFEFDLANAIIDAVLNQNSTQLKSKVNEILDTYSFGQYGSFLTNHDQDRSFNRFGQSIDRAKLAASLLLSLPGVPYLYYGEEIGMTGQKPDELIRTPMQWSSNTQAGFTTGNPWQAVNSNYLEYNVENQQNRENSLLNHYKKWIRLRHQNPALRSGELHWLNGNSGSIFSYMRTLEDPSNKIIIVHNLSSQVQEQISINGSVNGLSQGNYILIDATNENEVSTLEVSTNGTVNAQLNIDLEGRTSIALKLILQ